MRTTLSVLSLCVCLTACDFPKSVGDDGTTTGEDPTEGTSSTVSGFPGESSTVTGFPGSASATVTSGGGMTTASPGECPAVDLGPSDDPNSEYLWECYCTTCTLTYEDIPLETTMAFDQGGLCDCLCEANNCGDVEGEGGVSGGSLETGDTEFGTDSATATSGVWETEGGTEPGGSALTYAACIDQGGVIVGDSGDGAVFEPDYVCPSGESPIGILDFEPGMPFPKNGGVCCPPEA